jgi:protein O-GlcNAc transferase
MTDNTPTLDQLLQSALVHHQAGRLPQAEAICRQVLQRDARSADALHLLGVIAYQVGRWEIAVDLIRQAIAFQPGNVEAHGNLCSILREKGRLDEAVVAYRQLINVTPNSADAYIILGNTLIDAGRPEEAIAAYRQAIAIKPDYAEVYSNLGNVLKNTGRLEEAIAAYRQGIALKPDYAEAHNNLGNALKDSGQLAEAVVAYSRAIALKADYAGAYNNLGDALRGIGRLDEAIVALRQAIALKGDYVEPYNSLGIALKENGQLDEAIAICRQAISLKPDYADAYVNLGNALTYKAQLDEAVTAYRQAIAIMPDGVVAHHNLGNALKDKGLIEEAIAAYRHAIALKPDNPQVHSSLIYSIHCHPGYDADAIAEEHRGWGRQHAQPLAKFIRPHSNDHGPNRRLRVGYVSPDLRDHPVGRFLLPLLSHHDKSQVEVFAYSQVCVADAMTQHLRSHVDCWRSILGLADGQVADLIHEDQIDILIDLAGHTGGNRLGVFARKPAPVQVTWLGYPNTTGLAAIDYRLTDALADPPGMTDTLCCERLIRLPQTAWCFAAPPGDLSIDRKTLTAATPITFGSFNNFSKITPAMLELWAKILRSTPGSRLSIKATALRGESDRHRVQQIMEAAGIGLDRLDLMEWRKSHEEHLACYRQVDIALDTFPYHGTTTTCEALWMQVPVVTLAGSTHVSRVGVSLMTNVGLGELVAHGEDEYVRIASELARDLPRLAQLRASLRGRMQDSPLMDARRFASGIEDAYRTVWRNWCEKIAG